MIKDEILIKASYIKTSTYREKVVKTLSEKKIQTPTQISENTNILVNHISKTLNELKTEGIIRCLNENRRKGRLYQLTPLGKETLNGLNYLKKGE